MSFAYSGKTFFFVGRAAAHRDLSDVPPLDPRSYILQPGSRPLVNPDEPTPGKAAIETVERVIEQMGGFDGL